MEREVKIVTPEQVELQFELAGIGSRFLAAVVDSLYLCLYAILFTIIGAFITVTISATVGKNQYVMYIVAAIFIVLYFVLVAGYYIYYEYNRNGQTPGKKMIGLRVIRDSGHPIDFRSALLRNLMRIVDSLPSGYAIGLVSILISPQCQRVGDYVAGTLVVKEGRFNEAPVSNIIANAASVPTIELPLEILPYIGSLSKDDYRALQHFIDRSTSISHEMVDKFAVSILENLMPKLHMATLPSEDKLAFIKAICKEWERRNIH